MVKKAAEKSGLKSALKWVGGKRRIAKEIVSFFPQEYSSYFEPFLGGASIFLEARPKKAFLSDLNPSLINFYVSLRDDPKTLMEQARELEMSFNSLQTQDQKKEHFYQIRGEFNELAHDRGVENASRFLYLNKTAFNGLYRENASGKFNVPFNNKDNLRLFDEENFIENSNALSGTHLSSQTFSDAVDRVKRGDLIYFDPPYVPLSSTAAFTDYTKVAFGQKAQEQLRDKAISLVKKGATVILSNSYSPIVQKLYEDFELHEIKINRLVAASSLSRGSMSEYVIVGRPNG